MKLQAAEFSRFLELINLSGDIEIKECIFRCDKDKLGVIAVEPKSKAIIIRGEMKGDFSDWDVMGIDDLTLLHKMVSSCKGEIDVVRSNDKLNITSGKKLKASLKLRNPQYILNEVDQVKYDNVYNRTLGNEFTLKLDHIDEFRNYYQVMGKEISISGEGKDIVFNIVNGDNSLDLGIEIDETVKKFDMKVAGLFMKILEVIDSTIKVSITGSPHPMLITKDDNGNKVEYIIGPLVK
jgi:hypothetical protein